jgi:hypothetical protein
MCAREYSEWLTDGQLDWLTDNFTRITLNFEKIDFGILESNF